MISIQRILLTAGCLICIGLLIDLSREEAAVYDAPAPAFVREGQVSAQDEPRRAILPGCENTSGLDDVVVVLKTGATEIYQKLPIHFATTFACAPDHLIYSDVEQKVGGREVRDAMGLVSEEMRSGHEDLEQYRMLQEHVRAARDIAELKDFQGWELDKWKFLPMISDAYGTFGDNKTWYVFIEADTYLSIHNLLLWLPRLDARLPVYAGAQVYMQGTKFAHGGSGWLLSSQAAAQVQEIYEQQRSSWENRVAADCCGDRITAEVLQQADPPVNMTHAFPLIQGETISSLDWSTKHWCMPAVTWHHVDTAGIDSQWQFEQAWRLEHGAEEPILFADYYESFVHPRIAAANGTMKGWDNLSSEKIVSAEEDAQVVAEDTAEACEEACVSRPKCLQWAWAPNSCRVDDVVRLGWALNNRPALGSADDRKPKVDEESAEGAVSGWLLERIEAYKEKLSPCKWPM